MIHEIPLSEEIKIAIINYLSGNWDDCDSGLLDAWLEENSENARLFGQLVNLWEADMLIKREKSFDANSAWARLESKMNAQTTIVNRLGGFKQIFRYAAIFILALALGGTGSYLTHNNFEIFKSSKNSIEYTAPYGSKTKLKLLDGSLVWLNAGTTLKYDQGFGADNRDIQLSGEAYFEVAKNKKLPFIVKAKDVSVLAVGTIFNVKAYPDEQTVETILIEGSVELDNLESKTQKSILLNPNQKATFYPDQNQFIVSDIEDAHETSWRTDNWIVKNVNLSSFAKLLERRYNIEITFEEDNIKNYQFTGNIKDETIEQILTAMTHTAPLKYKIIHKNVSISIDENKLNKYNNILK